MKLLFLKIALLYFSVSFIGQNPNSFIIGEEDLKGVEIYSLCFHENLLFAATNNGLYKQEGNGFKSIPFKGNPVSSLFELKEDNLGKLFCKTLSGQIYQLENDSLILFYELSKTNNARITASDLRNCNSWTITAILLDSSNGYYIQGCSRESGKR